MSKSKRLDSSMVKQGLVSSSSQAKKINSLNKLKLNSRPIQYIEHPIKLDAKDIYVSRAGLKLDFANQTFKVNFKNNIVLDVGSSTGGFSDYALKHGAKQVVAVDKGSHQMHHSLRLNKQLSLYEKTDIRDFKTNLCPDVVLIDVSFISLVEILPHIHKLVSKKSKIIAMVKPQFETKDNKLKIDGVIKNNRLRRQILKQFEEQIKHQFRILAKVDSRVPGVKGNIERFYYLKKI